MRAPRLPVPERLTLVYDADPHNVRTIVVDDEMGSLIVSATHGPEKITVALNEEQAKRLRGRVDKFLRENR